MAKDLPMFTDVTHPYRDARDRRSAVPWSCWPPSCLTRIPAPARTVAPAPATRRQRRQRVAGLRQRPWRAAEARHSRAQGSVRLARRAAPVAGPLDAERFDAAVVQPVRRGRADAGLPEVARVRARGQRRDGRRSVPDGRARVPRAAAAARGLVSAAGRRPPRRSSRRCSRRAPGCRSRAKISIASALLDPAHNLRVGAALLDDVGGGARRDRSRARQHAAPHRDRALLLGRSRLGRDGRGPHADGAPPPAGGVHQRAGRLPRLVAGADDRLAARGRRRASGTSGLGRRSRRRRARAPRASTSTPPSASRCARSPTASCSSPAST